MSESFPFTIKDVSDKLKVGESTLNVWRNRYREWVLEVSDHDKKLFSPESIELFRFISECTDSGMDTWEIKDALTSMGGQVVHEDVSGDEAKDAPAEHQDENTDKKGSNTQIGSELLNPLKGLFSDIVNQQNRIADAQERRAAAEERKAYALESRAEAELLKANVMRDIVTALQDMAVKNTVNSLMDKVKNMPGPSMGDLQELSGDLGLGLGEMNDLPELTSVADLDAPSAESLEEPGEDVLPDGLSHSTDQGTEQISGEIKDQGPVDVEQVNVATEIETFQTEEIDDLSELINETDFKADADEIDDLSKLLDSEVSPQYEGDMDDLSVMIDGEVVEAASDIDDLSMLLEGAVETVSSDVNMDDLSVLISEEPVSAVQEDMDDLSALIDISITKSAETSGSEKPIEEKPSVEKPAVDPNYKSEILKRIIGMKQKEGLSIDEVTKKFNDEGVKTLSGKGQWDKKTIAGIYKYIDSVQGS